MNDPFAEIRPYQDQDVSEVLSRLLHNTEFLDALVSYRMGNSAATAPALILSLLGPVMRYRVRRQLLAELRGVANVRGVQSVIERYLDQMIGRATAGFSVSGLDQLERGAYLYMSNHRDIAMDPAFTNYALHGSGRDTVRIAIGDNLLTKPWVSDLMRLNKSFIVKRSISKPRELLKATKTLSNFIQHSLLQDNESVWLAQREGRAKNGVDRTEPVIIKMLSMSRDKKQQDFAQHIAGLRIVPVAISYELDPCDAMKANELYHLASAGTYEKGAQEDVLSIARGIAGDKGRVHVSFGTPLGLGFDTPEAVAAEVDRQVVALYCLHPTNIYAYRQLHGEDAPIPKEFYLEEGAISQRDFDARINALPQNHRLHALEIYANAVVSKVNSLAAVEAQQVPC